MGDQRGTRVYVGNLNDKIKKDDLEEEFTKYGKLNSVWIALNPPGFAFVEFEHRDDAEKACDDLNGADLLGSQLRVEISKGRRRDGGGGGRGDRGGGRRDYGRGGDYQSRSFDRSGGRRPGGGGGYSGGRDSGYGRRDDYGSRDNGRSFSGGGGGGGYGSGRSGGGGGGGGGRFRSRSPTGNRRF